MAIDQECPMFHATSEDGNVCTRRHWLKAAGALTVGATCAHTLHAATQPDNLPAPRMQIGILMGTFARPTLEARLDAVKACGLVRTLSWLTPRISAATVMPATKRPVTASWTTIVISPY
jgi:hypothetical protein